MGKERKGNFIKNWLFVSTQLQYCCASIYDGGIDDGSGTMGEGCASFLVRLYDPKRRFLASWFS
jgi:hypothetical protein